MVEDKRYFFDDAETAREGARLRLIGVDQRRRSLVLAGQPIVGQM